MPSGAGVAATRSAGGTPGGRGTDLAWNLLLSPHQSGADRAFFVWVDWPPPPRAMEGTAMLSPQTISTVSATAPVLAQQGADIIQRFYAHLFAAHPELKHVFNVRHQERGEQQQALATAVAAYAAHIADPQLLEPVLRRIAHKHASVGVQPNQYPLVGEELLAAIHDELGAAATPNILQAWGEAYQALAASFIDLEGALYEA